MVYITERTTLINPAAMLAHLPLRAGLRVGDLGCGGHGQIAAAAARAVGDSGTVYLVDIRKSALAELVKKTRLIGIRNVKSIWANLELVGATGLPAGTLDAAMLINVMFQAQDKASVFLETKRLLKSGGALLVVDWKTAATRLGPPSDHRVPPNELEAYARAAGFQLRETFDAGPYHYGLVFTR